MQKSRMRLFTFEGHHMSYVLLAMFVLATSPDVIHLVQAVESGIFHVVANWASRTMVSTPVFLVALIRDALPKAIVNPSILRRVQVALSELDEPVVSVSFSSVEARQSWEAL
ncbi:hypothetical protein K438DRAFT_1998191 [Mycena galopus ATCC 62051]|nr:hypothetical protein K438DRAFT_1998191 [Mycena galopus ATCC 62051]